jgi:hypothetical protein
MKISKNMIILLFAILSIAQSKLISISVVTDTNIDNARAQMSQAYMQYLYSPSSTDTVQLVLNGQVILGATPLYNKQLILQTIQALHVNNPTFASCCSNYFFDNFSNSPTSMVYLLIDKDSCNLIPELVKAQSLKQRGIKIFPIGLGRGISDLTLRQLAGPCMGTCLPGWNYLKL